MEVKFLESHTPFTVHMKVSYRQTTIGTAYYTPGPILAHPCLIPRIL